MHMLNGSHSESYSGGSIGLPGRESPRDFSTEIMVLWLSSPGAPRQGPLTGPRAQRGRSPSTSPLPRCRLRPLGAPAALVARFLSFRLDSGLGFLDFGWISAGFGFRLSFTRILVGFDLIWLDFNWI